MNYSERADELCADLKERFLVGNGPRKYELKAALANCKQGGDLVNAYYNCLKKIWDELQHYIQLPTSKATAKEEEQVYQFLIGLNDSMYGMFHPRSSKRICKEEQHCQLARVAMA